MVALNPMVRKKRLLGRVTRELRGVRNLLEETSVDVGTCKGVLADLQRMRGFVRLTIDENGGELNHVEELPR